MLLNLLLLLSVSAFGHMEDTLYVTYHDTVESYFSASAERALKRGLLTKKEKKKQPALVQFLGRTMPAKVRMKGDWTDHVKQDQWSLRINLKEGNVYAAAKFSIQFPETRGGEEEMIFHQWLTKNSILTTHYTFLHVVVNGKYWGRFAFEEHFDEPLLERNKRANGPIIKFDEDGFWQCQRASMELPDDICVEYDIFAAAEIKPFGKKRTYQDSVLHARFSSAYEVLDDWRKGKLNADRIDVNKFAAYIAYCDLFQFYHGLQWHNQRFYYNVASQKLEPVAFDCYSKTNSLIGKAFLGFFNEHYSTIYFHEQWFNYQLFTIPEFIEAYKSTVEGFYNQERWNEIEGKEELISRLKDRAEELNEALKSNQLSPKYYSYSDWKKDNPKQVKIYPFEFPSKPFKDVQVRAVQYGDSLVVRNYHIAPLHIVGYTTDSVDQGFYKPRLLQPGEEQVWKVIDARSLLVLANSGEDTLQTKIQRIQRSSPFIARPFGVTNDYFILNEEKERFEWDSTITQLNEPLYLDGEQEYFLEGVIEFGPNGLLIVDGNLTLANTHLKSIASGNNGVRVFNGDFKMYGSAITDFKINPAWANAPVQVFNSSVMIHYGELQSIDAEDAINLVNCDVDIQLMVVDTCTGDGIDMDFCRGSLSEIRTSYCGGDGIDMSFSEVKLDQVYTNDCADKGISIGEQSMAQINLIRIWNCLTGIAVKDASVTEVVDAEFENCETEIHLFRKKDFFEQGGTLMVDEEFNLVKDHYSQVIKR